MSASTITPCTNTALLEQAQSFKPGDGKAVTSIYHNEDVVVCCARDDKGAIDIYVAKAADKVFKKAELIGTFGCRCGPGMHNYWNVKVPGDEKVHELCTIGKAVTPPYGHLVPGWDSKPTLQIVTEAFKPAAPQPGYWENPNY